MAADRSFVLRLVFFVTLFFAENIVRSQQEDSDEEIQFEPIEYVLHRQGRAPRGPPPIRKRGVISILRPGKRSSYDFDDESGESIEKRAIIFYPPPVRHRPQGKRAVVSIMRPGKRLDVNLDDYYADFVDKRAVVSLIRPGKRLGYNVVTHGLGKRGTGNDEYYDAMFHTLGKRTGYNVLSHGFGKRMTEDNNDYYDFLIHDGMGKRAVLSIVRPGGKRSYEESLEDLDGEEEDKK